MIKNILNFPFMYQLLQTICLTENFRKNVITEKIKSDNQIILDIGCDPGNMIKYLKFVNYYGFDSDKNYIDYAKNKYKECSFFLEEFSLKSTKKIEKVDTVLLSGLLHHLSDDEIKELMSAIKLSVKKSFK
ncbi:methyltransferase domain-containing protein [Pelagibacterales bacterium SAG-MED06]|nr:methyltransferase domain-containing protein [Pelagibacterales bacterium SAG-MED06]|tara:strand:+ start:6906 stop:7298 length:393 start_codon:yes stop_codon:yes gene_type:complete